MTSPATSTIRSDALPSLRPFFEQNGSLKVFGQIFQMAVIIDANIIIRDILWLARKRKNAEARTELLEVLFAETILPFAPTFLEEEIKKNLPEVALEHNLSINVLETHWETYKKRITFVDMGGADCSYEDPKDAPYLKLQAELGYLILSKDTDIPRMGGRVAGTAVIARLRTYSRHVAVEYTLKMGGVGSITISYSVLRAAGRFARTLISKAKRLPRWVWVSAIVILVGALLYPPTRKYIINFVQSLSGRSKMLGTSFLETFGTLSVEHGRAKKAAAEALSDISRPISIAIEDKS